MNQEFREFNFFNNDKFKEMVISLRTARVMSYRHIIVIQILNYNYIAMYINVSNILYLLCIICTYVYLDLSKAFDSLSHKMLLDKIKHLGITGFAYKLLQSYLLNRQQYVAFKNCRSDLKFINKGVIFDLHK